jgi:predicted dehydrogenase
LVGLCETNAVLLERGRVSADLEPRAVHADLDDLLSRDDVDAVAVVVEPENAASVAVRALQAGKHVLSDVPAAFSIDGCHELVAAVRASGCWYGLAEQTTYAPFTRAWQRLYRDGRLGEILYGEAQYLHGATPDRFWHDPVTGDRLSWAEATKIPDAVRSRLWSMLHPIWYTPHSLAPLLHVLDTHVTAVSCFATPSPSQVYPDYPVADLEVALMRTASGAILRLAAGFTAPSAVPHHWHHLVGTGGEVETGRLVHGGESPSNGGALAWFAKDFQRGRQPVDWDFSDYDSAFAGKNRVALPHGGHGGMDIYPVLDFVEAVEVDRAPLLDVYRACNIAAPAIAAGRSAELGGQLVDVPVFGP